MGIISRIFGREKRSATHPRDPALAEWLGIGTGTSSGVNVTPDTARACPEVDACVSLIEDTLGTVPLDLFERVGKNERVKCTAHPLHQLLHDSPNSWQTSAEFRIMMEGWRSTHGNAYAEVIWGSDGIPKALEPICPTEVRPFKTQKGTVAYRLLKSSRILLASEMLHLKDKPAKLSNILEGQSRVERHKESIGLAMATSEYLSRFFSNNAVPKSFLEVPGELSKEQAADLREQFERKHGGLENSHKVGIIQAGMKLNQLASNNDEAKTIEVYQMAVARIARIWGIPLHLIGEHTKSTSWGSGIEQQSIGFIMYYMRPKFVMWEQACNRVLLSSEQRHKYFFEFNADALLRGDFKSRMDGYALMIQWGLAAPNEIRQLMNMPPVTGGDETLHPLNMVPASKVMDVLMKSTNQKGNINEN